MVKFPKITWIDLKYHKWPQAQMPKWPQMTSHDLKLPQTASNDHEWPQITWIDLKDHKWHQMNKKNTNHYKWSQMM